MCLFYFYMKYLHVSNIALRSHTHFLYKKGIWICYGSHIFFLYLSLNNWIVAVTREIKLSFHGNISTSGVWCIYENENKMYMDFWLIRYNVKVLYLSVFQLQCSKNICRIKMLFITISVSKITCFYMILIRFSTFCVLCFTFEFCNAVLTKTVFQFVVVCPNSIVLANQEIW